FGREHELSQLLGAFELVAAGGVELCLVTGQSGVGKSALVNEIGKALVRERGYLIQGKFDLFQANAAFSAVGGAIRGLIAQLLTEPSDDLDRWRERIVEALGPNA